MESKRRRYTYINNAKIEIETVYYKRGYNTHYLFSDNFKLEKVLSQKVLAQPKIANSKTDTLKILTPQKIKGSLIITWNAVNLRRIKIV